MLNSDGTIQLANNKLRPLGNIAPTANNIGFAYTSTDTSIHLYWDGTNGSSRIVLRRADGTKIAIPGGDIQVTGLAASTTYYCLPYWSTLTAPCNISFVPGTVGSPQIFFTVATDLNAYQQQNLQTVEALSSGFLSVVTAAGGGTGGGGTGGGGFCVMQGTDIEPLGDGEVFKQLHGQTEWIRLQAGPYSLNCTPDHRVYTEFGLKKAGEITLADRLITVDGLRQVTVAEPFTRSCSKISVHMKSGHLYWANGILSHNMKQFN
jgi:hypothetical protein